MPNKMENIVSLKKDAAPSNIIKDIEILDQERNQALNALKEMLR